MFDDKCLMFKVMTVCCCSILLFGCNFQPNQTNLISAKVMRVVSGQTIEVMLAGTSEVAQVRIVGIDAPDFRQSPWGKTAQQKLSKLVTGLPIKLEMETSQQDSFNRLNAHVWQAKTLVSQELVKDGSVLANTRYNHSYSKLLIDAQEYARLMGYGIWNPKQAMRYTPNQFRSNLKQ
ncbi:thermonuclease family protein [Pleurocapsa sp. FMAR1]|uniref:thermonuclease family protein n=1 Tax=Pleurocapsa sp. FMAR1 TaxID=3040204 RepID=UPI0029C6A07C|nr:thermonuclease family protein [Pleurocapsa sp. FMAR1]